MTVRIREQNINTAEFWDETWEAEPDWHDSFGIDPSRYEALAAPCRPGMNVLDVGGGRGEFLGRLGPDVHKTLLDQSAYAVRYATERGWIDEGVVADCTDLLPFWEDSFDAVYCCEALEHVEDPAALLKELRRVSNGYVAISTPDRNTPDDQQHVWSFDVEDIAELMPTAEISVIGHSIVAVLRDL